MMRIPGMVRKMDDLGRVVIPLELRNAMNIQGGDQLEILVDNDVLILRKFSPGCTFCGNREELLTFEGKQICESCLRKLRRV